MVNARRALRGLCCTAVFTILGCADAERPEPTAAAPGPATDFHLLEERLLAADSVRFEFHVTAEGAIEADLRGALSIVPDAETRLTASGTFDGRAVDLMLRSVDDEIEFGSTPSLMRTPMPPYLEESLVIGVTRMGILHNLARLAGGAAPDHAEGGVRDWVTVGPVEGDAGALSFDLTVAREPAGFAVLEIDSAGRPALRRQTVEFPFGQMRVVERYDAFTIEE